MVSYNAVGLDLSGITSAIDAYSKRRLLEEEKAKNAAEVGAFGDRLLGTIATSGGAGGGAPSRAQELMGLGKNSEIRDRFVGTLREGGLTNPYGLAAFAAYGDAESGYNPKNITGSWSDPSERGAPGTSGGILSWREDRLRNMQRQTAGASDPVVAQAQFALRENPQVTAALQNAKSPEEANSILANAWRFAGYNRPGGENARRLGMTQQYVSAVNNNKGTAGVASEAGTQPVQVASAADADLPVRGATETGQFNLPGGRGGVGAGSEVGPERLEMLRQGLQSRNPAVQQMAIQEINRIREAQSKGPNYETVAPGATVFDPRTGRAIYTAPKDGAGEKWEFKELKDGRVVLYNERTGQTKAPEGLPGQSTERPPNFDQEAKLRDEFAKRTRDFDEVQDAYGRVAAAVEGRVKNPEAISPASDMSLVFGFMKMLDPASVVREGEYATAQNTTGIPSKILNAYNKAVSGEFLDENQREDMVKSAQRLYERKYDQTAKVADNYRRLATTYGADPGRVISFPERLAMPEIPRRVSTVNAPQLPGARREANQYGVVPASREWTNPDGAPPNVIKRGAYTVRQLD